MNKFIKKFNSTIQPDKWGHFKVGFIIVSVLEISGLILHLGGFNINQYAVSIIALWALILISMGKEIKDSLNPAKYVEFNDYTATVAGGALALFIFMCIKIIFVL